MSVPGKLQEFFAPIQFCVGIRNGCELMINAIRARLLLNENDICISCDAKNAFNSFDIEASSGLPFENTFHLWRSLFVLLTYMKAL
jgi:hypothetical protein